MICSINMSNIIKHLKTCFPCFNCLTRKKHKNNDNKKKGRKIPKCLKNIFHNWCIQNTANNDLEQEMSQN